MGNTHKKQGTKSSIEGNVTLRKFTLSIKTITGRLYDVIVTPMMTVGMIKKKIAAQYKVSFDRNALVYNGVALDDDYTLAQYEIFFETVINLNLDLKSQKKFGAISKTCSDYMKKNKIVV